MFMQTTDQFNQSFGPENSYQQEQIETLGHDA